MLHKGSLWLTVKYSGIFRAAPHKGQDTGTEVLFHDFELNPIPNISIFSYFAFAHTFPVVDNEIFKYSSAVPPQ